MSNRIELVAPRDRPTIFYRTTLAAPRELVFDAYTRPEHLRRWWGPRRLAMTECEIDAMPGGKWHFAQRDAQGQEFRFHGEYRDVKWPRWLVKTSTFEAEPQQELIETTELVDYGGQTQVKTFIVHPSVWVRNALLDGGMQQGIEESFSRLDELLARFTRPEDIAEAQW